MVALAYCAAPCDLHFRMLGRNEWGEKRKRSGQTPAFSNYGALSKVNRICYATRDYITDRSLNSSFELAFIGEKNRERLQSQHFLRLVVGTEMKRNVAFAAVQYVQHRHKPQLESNFGSLLRLHCDEEINSCL